MISLLNIGWYLLKRNSWAFDISRHLSDFDDVDINSPIFLLGTHGGGTTLISRMLRRNRKLVSVSGNYRYWSGADEMQVVLGPILPFEFSGITHKVPDHPKFQNHMSWLYATNDMIDKYRLTGEDVTGELREKFRHTLRWLIRRHAINQDTARFTDKSQSYTVKVSFISEILKGTNPRFVLITRNPYAVCYRAPFKAGGLKKIKNNFSFLELLKLASQHWANSMKYALKDRLKVDYFKILRFEDVLKNPEKNIKAVCDFTDLEFHEDMLPKPSHKVPFGSRFRDKWYPLRPNVNEKYFKEVGPKHVEIIHKYCKEYANEFDYSKPSV